MKTDVVCTTTLKSGLKVKVSFITKQEFLSYLDAHDIDYQTRSGRKLKKLAFDNHGCVLTDVK